MTTSESTLSGHVARALRRRAADLTRAWVEALETRLRVERIDALPSGAILNHIPLILERVADFVDDPEQDVLQAAVIADLRDLAELRRRQGFDVQEIMEEFELLASMLQDELERVVDDYGGPARPGEAIRVTGRLHQALLALSTITADFYRRRYVEDRRSRAELLGRFGRVLSHELRNRLGAGQTAAMVLANGGHEATADQRKRFGDVVLRSIRSALDVVDDVQALAASQVSDAAFEGRSVPLKPLVDQVIQDLAPLAEDRDVLLRADPETPAIPVPGGLVQIVLVNLVSNAIKYSDREKDERRVTLGAELGDESLVLRVEDNGIGIPAELHDRIFEEFERGHDGVADGLGLGLSIVKEAVVRMQGTIRLESEPDRGSTFYIRLPVSPGRSSAGGTDDDGTSEG